MALISKASLLMVPSTYEAGTLYNVLPSGNRAPDSTDQNSGYDQTRADFTFDRGSNAAATRIGSDGLIKKYRENLLLQSNDFGVLPWVNAGTTDTSGQEGYDGTNNAWLITKVSANGRMEQSVSSTGVSTLSVYAKANDSDWALIQHIGGGNPYAFFNLSTGEKGAIGGGAIDSKIESVENGWYRLSIVSSVTITQVRIYPAEINTTSGTSGSIYIQSAQLETGLVATDVLTSGATTAKAGVLIDLPRINYDANGENGSLLLEPSRQNKIQYSEHFDGWLKHNCTINTNAVTSPEGLQNASKIVENTSSGYHAVYLNNVFTADGTYKTGSVFVKAGERTFCAVSTRGAFGSRDKTLIFNLATGEWAYNQSGQNTGLEAEDFGDGWWRIVLNTNTTSAAYDGFIVGAAINGDDYNGAEYTGDGTSGIYIYGAQLEASASYPSSYIPNHGTTGGVTRAAENSTEAVDVENVPTGYPFAIYAEPYLTEAIGNGAFGFYNNSNQYSYYSLRITSQGKFNMLSRPQGVTQNEALSSSIFSQGFHKVVCLFESSTTIKLYVNGSLEATKSNCTNNGFNSAFNDYVLGVFRSLETKPCSIKKFIVFNEGLTNQECIDITA